MSHPVFLSVVLTGRNDDHGAGFARRFLRVLRFNHHQFVDHAIDHEFVFVEWGPCDDRPWLLDVVAGECPAVLPYCRWWLVDPRYTSACTLNPRMTYPEFHAKNVGLRRASGRFVLSSNCDVYFGREVLARVARQDLTPGILYRATRHDLVLGLDQQEVDWRLLEDSRNYAQESHALRPPYYAGATGDFLLIDRESLRALRGFNEIYRIARVGIDRNFRLHAHRNAVPIEDIGGAVYHANHAGSYHADKQRYRGREHEAPYGDDRWGAGTVTYSNPSSWGLGLAPERQLGPGVFWLDFDWEAVPPLAPLSRLGAEVW